MTAASGTEHAGLVARTQDLVESLYGLSGSPPATAFLETDRQRVERFAPGCAEVEEQLLVREHDGELELLLYLDTAVLARLAADDPFEAIHAGNLGDFFVLIEGVSHFLYVTCRAAEGRETTLLELELQAEVDKYFTVCLALDPARPRSVTGPVWHLQFERFRFAASLDARARAMYREANRMAARYCRRVMRAHEGRAVAGLLQELRSFRGLGGRRKLSPLAG